MKSNIIISLIFLINNHFTYYACQDDGEGELNDPCSNDKDCRYFGYVCKENTCQCDQWYIPNKDNKMCVGGVDQKCLYDEHCIDGGYCMNQVKCKCKRDKSQVLHHGFVCADYSRANQHKIILFVLMTSIVIGAIL